MQIGITLPALPQDAPAPTNLVDTAVHEARQAYQLGIRSVWIGQRFDYDAIGLAGLIGREVPGLAVGTSAVPIIGRHPLLLGAQAQTTQAATAGRFRLGIALGAKEFLHTVLGTTGDSQIKPLREFLTALDPLLRTGDVDFAGELITARTPWPSAVPGAQPPPPILVAAMGPRALRITGELADGSLPFLAGPKTLAEFLVPMINAAAESAGRPRPRVVALANGLVTDAVRGTRDAAFARMSFYESIPSYRAVLDREGAERAGELAVIGSREQVTAQIHRYAEAGATEVVLGQSSLGGTDDQLRTWELLGELTRQP
jgi:F420-dependent oxidoreductase-like protein